MTCSLIFLQREYKSYLLYELGMSENSVTAYISDIESFAKFYEKNVSDTKSEDIVAFMSFMRKKGLSLETILRRLSGLSQYFDFLILEKKILTNPVEFISKPKTWNKLPSFLEFDEIDKLLHYNNLSHIDERDSLIIETLYATGVRVSELINIKVQDIDFRRGIIKVTGKGSKQRIAALYETIREKLEKYLLIRQEYFVKDTDQGCLFLNRYGYKLTRQHIWAVIKKRCKEAGINKNISPHTMRHSFATHLLSGGADLRALQIFLGHANISTTEIYTHVTDDNKRRTIMKFHPRYAK